MKEITVRWEPLYTDAGGGLKGWNLYITGQTHRSEKFGTDNTNKFIAPNKVALISESCPQYDNDGGFLLYVRGCNISKDTIKVFVCRAEGEKVARALDAYNAHFLNESDTPTKEKRTLKLEFRNINGTAPEFRIIEQSHRQKDFGNCHGGHSFIASNGIELASHGCPDDSDKLFLCGSVITEDDKWRPLILRKQEDILKAVEEYNNHYSGQTIITSVECDYVFEYPTFLVKVNDNGMKIYGKEIH